MPWDWIKELRRLGSVKGTLNAFQIHPPELMQTLFTHRHFSAFVIRTSATDEGSRC